MKKGGGDLDEEPKRIQVFGGKGVSLLRLSIGEEQRLCDEWDKRNANPLTYVPHTLLAKVSADEANDKNKKLGSFASNYFTQVIAQGPVNYPENRIRNGESIIEVGPGAGYTSGWIRPAIKVGYKPILVDVSKFACEFMEEQSRLMNWASTNSFNLEPSVRRGEIQSVLADPNEIDQDLLVHVQFCFLCRVLSCVATNNSAKTVLELLGQRFLSSGTDPDKTKRIVIVNAFSNHNPDIVGSASTLLSKEFILYNAENGAGRKLEIVNEQFHQYYHKVVSAITLKTC